MKKKKYCRHKWGPPKKDSDEWVYHVVCEKCRKVKFV